MTKMRPKKRHIFGLFGVSEILFFWETEWIRNQDLMRETSLNTCTNDCGSKNCDPGQPHDLQKPQNDDKNEVKNVKPGSLRD